MSKTLTAEPLQRLAGHADRIDQLNADLKAELRARNRDVVAAVDDGYAQDAVARAIRRKPTAVTKILASDTTDPLDAA